MVLRISHAAATSVVVDAPVSGGVKRAAQDLVAGPGRGELRHQQVLEPVGTSHAHHEAIGGARLARRKHVGVLLHRLLDGYVTLTDVYHAAIDPGLLQPENRTGMMRDPHLIRFGISHTQL